MLTPSLYLTALAATTMASPVSSFSKHALWTTNNCTGSIEGDTTLVPPIPIDLIDYLESDLKAAYTFDGSSSDTSIDHQSFCTSDNDTSVIKVVDGASLTLDHVNILKYGYSSDLNQASFFGVNAAINVANNSHLQADNLNITAHNGAAGIYSYGTGTVVNSSHCSYYATGPVSHGAYASGNGTFNASNWYCLTEGYRSSCFSGDGPAGYLTIRDSEAYTYGLGSAVMYTLGQSYLYNVKGYAAKSPWTFMDGQQEIYVFDSDLEGGNLGGAIFFSSQGSGKVATVQITNSILRAHDATAAGLAVAGTTAEIALNSVEMFTESNILVSANSSLVPQSFDQWIAPADSPGPPVFSAAAIVTVSESQLSGDILAINGSTIDMYFNSHSIWNGKVQLDKVVVDGAAAVYLDETSAWNLTGDSYLQNFTITGNNVTNVASNGFNIHYNVSQSCNSWIGGGNMSLPGGGSLVGY